MDDSYHDYPYLDNGIGSYDLPDDPNETVRYSQSFAGIYVVVDREHLENSKFLRWADPLAPPKDNRRYYYYGPCANNEAAVATRDRLVADEKARRASNLEAATTTQVKRGSLTCSLVLLTLFIGLLVVVFFALN